MTRRRWLGAYVVLAMVGGLALMTGFLGRWVIVPGLAAMASAVAVLVATAIDPGQARQPRPGAPTPTG